MDLAYKIINDGSVTSPAGFLASGAIAGLKVSNAPDMALIFSENPANFSGAFTTCSFAAAPVKLCQQRVIEQPTLQAVIVNSGNANACTGAEGMKNAEIMADLTAAALKIEPGAVVVSSTGRIGVQLPMDKIASGITAAVAALDETGGKCAAEAIMTTDTCPKSMAVAIEIDGQQVTIGGMTKGVGMIDPKMTVPHATMLCYITTDAAIDNKLLGKMVADATEESFNRINIDGDMSTNDSLIMLANGVSGTAITAGSDNAEVFYHALKALTQQLARAMVMDGEGVTKFVNIEISNATSEADAELAANALANSLLCKTAWFGCDPNWGRLVAALGYSGAEFDPDAVVIHYDDQPVVMNGQDAGVPEAELAKILQQREFSVKVNLNAGNAGYWMWTNDISYEYVKINAEYHT
jgi:glutamate N-acetyltransferase / amino-acid N-acetyltransferase